MIVSRTMVREALTGEWQEEAQITAYVRRWARVPVDETGVAAALSVLERDGLAESMTPAGYRRPLWRRGRGGVLAA